jgi:electron transfer flavoprotein beta subunit
MELPLIGIDEIEVKEENIGLKGSPTRVVKIFTPKVSRECKKLEIKEEGDLDKAVDSLIDFIKEKEFV